MQIFIIFPILPVLSVTVFLTVWGELKKNSTLVYVFKPLSTLLIIGTAVMGYLTAKPAPLYGMAIIGGLIFSLGGDIALMFRDSKKTFLFGLILFLVAHIFYIVAFSSVGALYRQDIITGIALVSAAAVFLWMAGNNLKEMKLPVIFYLVIISLMVNRGSSLLFGSAVSSLQGAFIAAGVILFYISDWMLAHNRFVKPFSWERLSLIFYFSGQYLLALHVGLF